MLHTGSMCLDTFRGNLVQTASNRRVLTHFAGKLGWPWPFDLLTSRCSFERSRKRRFFFWPWPFDLAVFMQTRIIICDIWPWPLDLAMFMENSMTSFERSRKRRCCWPWPSRNDIRRKVLDIMQRCDMRRIEYMHGYVFPAGCTNFRPLEFSLLAGWKGVTSFERSRKRRCLFCWPFDLAVFLQTILMITAAAVAAANRPFVPSRNPSPTIVSPRRAPLGDRITQVHLKPACLFYC